MEAMMYIANFTERQVDIVVEDEATPTPIVTGTQQQLQRQEHRI